MTDVLDAVPIIRTEERFERIRVSPRPSGLYRFQRPFDAVLGVVQPLDLREAAFEARCLHVIGTYEEAERRVARPRSWVIRRRDASGHDFVNGELSSGPKHPSRLMIEAALVGDIHAYVLHPDHAKRRVAIGQIEGIADM